MRFTGSTVRRLLACCEHQPLTPPQISVSLDCFCDRSLISCREGKNWGCVMSGESRGGRVPTGAHAVLVGERSHRIARGLAGVCDGVKPVSPSVLLAYARDVLREHPARGRPRETFVECVTAAGVYLNRFRPVGWSLVDEFDDRRTFDLVYRHPDSGGVVIDELKLGGSGIDVTVRAQVDRYVESGRRQWGDRFCGVRVCLLHVPLHSRFCSPDQAELIALSDPAVPVGLGIR